MNINTNSSIHDSAHISESLEFDGSTMHFRNNHISGKLVGELMVTEYDAYGRPLHTSTEYNDLTLPGSVFILEQMFKVSANNRFDMGNAAITTFPNDPVHNQHDFTGSKFFNNEETATVTDISNEKIFGFMVGTGGEVGAGILAPDYRSTFLVNQNSESTFIPFQIVDPDTELTNYYGKITAKNNTVNKDYYFIKSLATTDGNKTSIISAWADGSGEADSNELGKYSVPVVTYAQCSLDIAATDCRAWFGEQNLDSCAINQLGLVSGIPVYDTTDTTKIINYTNIRLATIVNFKTRDLSNSENKLQITYKIYCL